MKELDKSLFSHPLPNHYHQPLIKTLAIYAQANGPTIWIVEIYNTAESKSMDKGNGNNKERVKNKVKMIKQCVIKYIKFKETGRQKKEPMNLQSKFPKYCQLTRG